MARPSPAHSGSRALVALGKAVRAARTERGVSQEALAHDADIDRSYLGGIERGEHNLTLATLLRVARQLDLKASDLLKRAGL